MGKRCDRKLLNKMFTAALIVGLLSSCTVNSKLPIISTREIFNESGNIVMSDEIQTAKINYLKFLDLHKANHTLDNKNIILECTVTELGFIRDLKINSEDSLNTKTKETIINNINKWNFSPAIAENGQKFSSKIMINWSQVYSDWLKISQDPKFKNDWINEYFFLYLEDSAPTKMSPPKYPRSALKNNIQGKVELAVRIAIDGSVSEAIVTKSITKALDEAAIAAIEKWSYPKKFDKSGQPINYWIPSSIDFSLH